MFKVNILSINIIKKFLGATKFEGHCPRMIPRRYGSVEPWPLNFSARLCFPPRFFPPPRRDVSDTQPSFFICTLCKLLTYASSSICWCVNCEHHTKQKNVSRYFNHSRYLKFSVKRRVAAEWMKISQSRCSIVIDSMSRPRWTFSRSQGIQCNFSAKLGCSFRKMSNA